MKRKASAVWKGGLKDGNGNITTDSGVLSETQYSFKTRFEEGKGTNPEELIAAAEAGCFSMALSNILGESDIRAERIDAIATVNLEKTEDGFTIDKVHLNVEVKSPGVDRDVFNDTVEKAKTGCPVSKVLNAEITMDAKLTG